MCFTRTPLIPESNASGLGDVGAEEIIFMIRCSTLALRWFTLGAQEALVVLSEEHKAVACTFHVASRLTTREVLPIVLLAVVWPNRRAAMASVAVEVLVLNVLGAWRVGVEQVALTAWLTNLTLVEIAPRSQEAFILFREEHEARAVLFVTSSGTTRDIAHVILLAIVRTERGATMASVAVEMVMHIICSPSSRSSSTQQRLSV